ncbi:MAG: hypothetical protein EHM77_06570, partial [Planctomycetaceae bacterium]
MAKEVPGTAATSSESDVASNIPLSADCNSYKFARPRVYVKNSFETADISRLDHLKYIATNVGPKGRTPAYSQFIDRQLQITKPARGKKTVKKEVSINHIDFSSPSLKVANFQLLEVPVQALVDTGSTHCLLSVSTFQKLSGLHFTPLKVHMKVAGNVLKDN